MKEDYSGMQVHFTDATGKTTPAARAFVSLAESRQEAPGMAAASGPSRTPCPVACGGALSPTAIDRLPADAGKRGLITLGDQSAARYIPDHVPAAEEGSPGTIRQTSTVLASIQAGLPVSIRSPQGRVHDDALHGRAVAPVVERWRPPGQPRRRRRRALLQNQPAGGSSARQGCGSGLPSRRQRAASIRVRAAGSRAPAERMNSASRTTSSQSSPWGCSAWGCSTLIAEERAP
jgi:hypothetical protein